MRAVLNLDERATYVHEGLDTAEIGCGDVGGDGDLGLVLGGLTLDSNTTVDFPVVGDEWLTRLEGPLVVSSGHIKFGATVLDANLSGVLLGLGVLVTLPLLLSGPGVVNSLQFRSFFVLDEIRIKMRVSLETQE
jgi:hypothetical protein